MKKFNYDSIATKLLTPKVVKYLNFIHEERGRQALFIEQSPHVLNGLKAIAKIQSTDSSNRIEGIHTSDKRLKELVKEYSTPQNRREEEIAGYRDVLSTIHSNYDYIPISSNIILQLHRDLYGYSGKSIGGQFKNTDNLITEIDREGVERIRFKPVPALETKDYMETLCDSFNKELEKAEHDPLILISIFILDFLCIHPFSDGNGRMSRLLTLLLLYKSGYIVGKYLSIEKIIEKTKVSYYETLKQSSYNWLQEENDYEPFVVYFLSIIKKAYVEFENRVKYVKVKTVSKAERVKLIIDNQIGQISKSEIMELAPDISKITIERSLSSLLKEGYIKKVGAGRNVTYVKV